MSTGDFYFAIILLGVIAVYLLGKIPPLLEEIKEKIGKEK